MKKRMIAPTILVISCALLAAIAFLRLQSRPLQSPDGTSSLLRGFSGLPASAIEREEAINSVMGQLEAFRHNDYARASYFQSPWTRVSIGDPRAFRYMIVNYYPEFASFTRVQVGGVLSAMNGQQVAVPISLTGKDGEKVSAVYMLSRGSDGVYRVTGVSGGRRARLP